MKCSEAMRIAKLLPGVKKGAAHLQGQNVLEVYPIEQSRGTKLIENKGDEENNYVYINRNI